MTKKSFRYLIAIILMVLVPHLLLAEEPEKKVTPVELERMEVRGEIIRPNMVGVLPEQGGVNDAAHLLQRVPGANVNGLGPLSGIAQYRGLYGDRVNVDFKGMNYKPACTNSMDAPLSHVPAAMTSLLKVYRGIAPVSSGIETIGGAIVQETKRPEFTAPGEPLDWTGKFAGGYNSVNAGHYAALYNGLATENHRLHMYGSKEFGDDFKFPGGRNVPTQHNREAVEIGYGFRHGTHVIDVDYNFNNTRDTGTPALPMDITKSEGGVLTTTYSGRITNGIGIKAAFNYQDIDHTMDNFRLRRSVSKRFSTNTSKGFGYRLHLDFPLLSGVAMIGVDGDNANHNAIITNPDMPAFRLNNFNHAERDRYGYFAEWTVSPIRDWTIELGSRVNHIVMRTGAVDTHFQTAPWRSLVDNFNNANRNKTDVNYDLTGIIRHNLTSNLELELGFARKTRSPSYQERYLWAPLESSAGLADGFLYIGNLDVKPETSYQGEVGLTWRKGSFYAAPRGFYRHVNNYIQGVPATNASALAIAGINNRPLLQFTNIDAILYGADLDAGFRFLNNWRVDGTLSYVRGKRDDANDNLFRIAPLNGLVSLFYEKPRGSLGTEVVGYLQQNKVSEFNNEPKTEGYMLWNIRGQINLLKGLQLGAGIENLLNTSYRVHLNGLNRAVNNVANGIGIGQRLPGIGRNFYFTLAYQW